ncbi:MAG: hypothetical protein AB2629_18250, partial [Candidatus Thiodiazotropha sp.]
MMKAKLTPLYAATALLMLGAGSAFAESTIEGDVEINVQTENVISASIGDGNTSEVSIGSISDSEVG